MTLKNLLEIGQLVAHETNADQVARMLSQAFPRKRHYVKYGNFPMTCVTSWLTHVTYLATL